MIFPVSVNAISIDEIEKKLSQAQSEEDIEQVLSEIVTSNEYQQACRELFEKIKIYQDQDILNQSTVSEKKKAEVVSVLRDYETLQCRWTQNIWGDAPKQYSKTQCNELIVKFEEYNEKYWDIEKENQRIFQTDGLEASIENKETSEWWYLKDLKRETKTEYRQFCVPIPQECEELYQESNVLNEKWIEIDEKYHNTTLEQKLVSIDLQEIKDRIELRCGYKKYHYAVL